MHYFLQVANAGSVSLAAEGLHVAASAVSRQISKLEESIGATLFERRSRGMDLTPAGERLAAHLRTGQEEAERVIEQVQGLAGQARREVHLACTEGFASGFLPAIINDFRDGFADAQVRLRVRTPEDVSQDLLRGEVELALKYSTAPEKGLRILYSAQAPLYALMRPTHPLARRRKVGLADVVEHPLVVGEKGVTSRQLFDLACTLQGLHYRPAVVSNFSSALLPLVHHNDIMLAGYLTAARLLADRTLVAVPFDDPVLQQRRLQLLALEGRTLSAAAQLLADRLVGAIEKHGKRKISR